MKSNQSKITCKRGFTLIELLVVVLIIGILAAVAVPQYKKAVKKSRLAKVKPLVASLAKASEAYYVTNGVRPRTFDELNVDVGGSNVVSLSDAKKMMLKMFGAEIDEETLEVLANSYIESLSNGTYRNFEWGYCSISAFAITCGSSEASYGYYMGPVAVGLGGSIYDDRVEPKSFFCQASTEAEADICIADGAEEVYRSFTNGIGVFVGKY